MTDHDQVHMAAMELKRAAEELASPPTCPMEAFIFGFLHCASAADAARELNRDGVFISIEQFSQTAKTAGDAALELIKAARDWRNENADLTAEQMLDLTKAIPKESTQAMTALGGMLVILMTLREQFCDAECGARLAEYQDAVNDAMILARDRKRESN